MLDTDVLAVLQAAIDSAERGLAYYGEGARYKLPDAVAPRPPPLTLLGGVASSTVLPQILADVLQRDVHVPVHPEHAPALGAAALGAAAAAQAAARQTIDVTLDIDPPPAARTYAPDSELRNLYDDAYACFCQVHPALRDLFKQLRAH